MKPTTRVASVLLGILLLALALSKIAEARGRAVATLTTQQRETMVAIRQAAMSMEKYAIINNSYPGRTAGLINVEVLRQLLPRKESKRLRLLDGWGNQILFWSDGSDYVLVSLGSDGKKDAVRTSFGASKNMSELLCEGASDEGMKDIVFSDGQFCSYPRAAE